MLIDLSETFAERSYLPKYEKAEEMNENWQYLKEELLSLIDYRLSSSNARWYQEQYMYNKLEIEEFTPHFPSDMVCQVPHIYPVQVCDTEEDESCPLREVCLQTLQSPGFPPLYH